MKERCKPLPYSTAWRCPKQSSAEAPGKQGPPFSACPGHIDCTRPGIASVWAQPVPGSAVRLRRLGEPVLQPPATERSRLPAPLALTDHPGLPDVAAGRPRAGSLLLERCAGQGGGRRQAPVQRGEGHAPPVTAPRLPEVQHAGRALPLNQGGLALPLMTHLAGIITHPGRMQGKK